MILDIEDMTKPKFILHFNTAPAFPWPTHTCLALPYELQKRKIMLLASEDAGRMRDFYPAFLWVYDITDERQPIPFSSYQVEGIDGSVQPEMTGVHQPSEVITGTDIPVAWFAYGLRILDMSNPHSIKEVAHFMPDVTDERAKGRVQSNDVTIDPEHGAHLPFGPHPGLLHPGARLALFGPPAVPASPSLAAGVAEDLRGRGRPNARGQPFPSRAPGAVNRSIPTPTGAGSRLSTDR